VSGSSKPAEPALPGSVRHRDTPGAGGSSAPTAGALASSPTSPAAASRAAAAVTEPDASSSSAAATAAGARRTPSPPSSSSADDGDASSAAVAITAASAAQPSPPPASPSPPAVDPITLPHVRGTVRAGGRAWLADGTNAGPSRLAKFARLLDVRAVDGDALRQLAWSGVPACYRKAVWQMLLGHLPLARERQPGSLAKRKAEYRNTMGLYFGSGAGGGSGGGGGGIGGGGGGTGGGLLGGLGKSESEQTLLRQVLVDVPRTNPEVPLLHTEWVQRSLERVLYTWAMRHPASGYVQGINDLATPFYAVFLSPWADLDFTGDVAGLVDPDTLAELEADVYWCLTRLLDGIQDHYTPGQPGIQRMTVRLRELVNRIDGA
jgi:TBC1 domain family member 2